MKPGLTALTLIAVGSSSRDLPLAHSLTIEAPSLAEPLTRMSTLHEWRADPVGRELLDAAVGGGPLANEGFVSIVGSMPMDTLASFGLGLDHARLDNMVAAWQRQHTPTDAG